MAADPMWRTHRGELLDTAELYRRAALMLEHAQLPPAYLYNRALTAAALILWADPARERDHRAVAWLREQPMRLYLARYGQEPYRQLRAIEVLRRSARMLYADAQRARSGPAGD